MNLCFAVIIFVLGAAAVYCFDSSNARDSSSSAKALRRVGRYAPCEFLRRKLANATTTRKQNSLQRKVEKCEERVASKCSRWIVRLQAGNLNKIRNAILLNKLETKCNMTLPTPTTIPCTVDPGIYWYNSSDNDLPIPDNGYGSLVAQINIPDTCSISDIDIHLDIVHPWAQDIVAKVIAPDGTEVILLWRVGNDHDQNFSGTVLDQEAAQYIKNGTSPFTGRFKPESSLEPLYGKNSAGNWSLSLVDQSADSVGSLQSWKIVLTLGT